MNFAFFFVAACCLLAFKRYRPLAVGGATALIAGPLIFALPGTAGDLLLHPQLLPGTVGRRPVRAWLHPLLANTRNPLNGFDPVTPLKMLGSDHRGLFLWTPLTALAVVGFVLLVYRARHDDRRQFLLTLSASAFALLFAHSIWGFWDGAFSFSSRFLTALFPVFLIGVAELRRRFGGADLRAPDRVRSVVNDARVRALIGYEGITAGDGVRRTWAVTRQTHDQLEHKLKLSATDRWKYLWALLTATIRST